MYHLSKVVEQSKANFCLTLTFFVCKCKNRAKHVIAMVHQHNITEAVLSFNSHPSQW